MSDDVKNEDTSKAGDAGARGAKKGFPARGGIARELIIAAAAALCLAVIAWYIFWGPSFTDDFERSMMKFAAETELIRVNKPADFPAVLEFDAEEAFPAASVDFGGRNFDMDALLYLVHRARALPVAPAEGVAALKPADLSGDAAAFSGKPVKVDCRYVLAVPFDLPDGNRTGLDRVYISFLFSVIGGDPVYAVTAEDPAWNGFWENDDATCAGYAYKVVDLEGREFPAPCIVADCLVKPPLPPLATSDDLLLRVRDTELEQKASLESGAYYHLLHKAALMPQSRIEALTDKDVTYKDIWADPDSYRGKVVTFEGFVIKAFSRKKLPRPQDFEAPGMSGIRNATGLRNAWYGQIQDPSNPDVIMTIECVEPPEYLMADYCRVTGFFLKWWAYMKDTSKPEASLYNWQYSPLIICREVEFPRRD